ncbi:hypothetical protein ES708_09573 [subsurface metagenome]
MGNTILSLNFSQVSAISLRYFSKSSAMNFLLESPISIPLASNIKIAVNPQIKALSIFPPSRLNLTARNLSYAFAPPTNHTEGFLGLNKDWTISNSRFTTGPAQIFGQPTKET